MKQLNNRLEQTEFRKLLSIAFPMIVSQTSDTVMLFVDRLFLSYLGKLHIAASMSGGLTHYVFVSFFVGTVGYVNAIVAQYYGSGQKHQCSRSTSQAVYLALTCFPILLLLISPMRHFFSLAGHGEEQIALEYAYFRILMFGAVFMVIRNAFNGFFIGIGKTRMVMIANIVAMVVNVPCNYLLIFGKMGFPAMGIEGAAVGTICGSFAGLLVLLGTYFSKQFRGTYKTHEEWRFNPRLLVKLLKFGLPAGTEMFLNVMAFNVFLQFMHSYGEDVAAAVTITFNWDMVAFIPMIGLGIATTARVGQHIGGGNIKGARHTVKLAMGMGAVYAGSMIALFLFATRSLVTLFTGGFSGDEGAVVSLAVIMLRLASIYTLADATQLVFAGALRGAGDTRWVMWISVIMHWILAVATFIMIRILNVSPVGMWLFLIGFVIALGLVMFFRFQRGKWEKIQLIEKN